MARLPLPTHVNGPAWRLIFKLALGQRRHTPADVDAIVPWPPPPPSFSNHTPVTLIQPLVDHLLAQTLLPRSFSDPIKSLEDALTLACHLHVHFSKAVTQQDAASSNFVTPALIDERRSMLSKLGTTPHDQAIRTVLQSAIVAMRRDLSLQANFSQISTWHAAIEALVEDCRDRASDASATADAVEQCLEKAQASISEALSRIKASSDR
jgi:hypothetical protein